MRRGHGRIRPRRAPGSQPRAGLAAGQRDERGAVTQVVDAAPDRLDDVARRDRRQCLVHRLPGGPEPAGGLRPGDDDEVGAGLLRGEQELGHPAGHGQRAEVGHLLGEGLQALGDVAGDRDAQLAVGLEEPGRHGRRDAQHARAVDQGAHRRVVRDVRDDVLQAHALEPAIADEVEHQLGIGRLPPPRPDPPVQEHVEGVRGVPGLVEHRLPGQRLHRAQADDRGEVTGIQATEPLDLPELLDRRPHGGTLAFLTITAPDRNTADRAVAEWHRAGGPGRPSRPHPACRAGGRARRHAEHHPPAQQARGLRDGAPGRDLLEGVGIEALARRGVRAHDRVLERVPGRGVVEDEVHGPPVVAVDPEDRVDPQRPGAVRRAGDLVVSAKTRSSRELTR